MEKKSNGQKKVEKAILNHFKSKNENDKKAKDAEDFRSGAMALNDRLAADQKAYDDWRWRESMKS